MKPIWKFRLLVLLICIFVAGISIPNLLAEILRPPPSSLPSRANAAPTPDQISSARRAAAIAPFRSDLKADYALALAGKTLRSSSPDQHQDDDVAKDAVEDALRIGPHDSRMWLFLGSLQKRSNPGHPLIAEALKMSYLTGPNRAELIPVRLDLVTLGNCLSDSDLSDLARGDVRAIISHLPDQRQSLVDDYVRGSAIGKAFLDDNIRAFDPKFADTLRNAK